MPQRVVVLHGSGGRNKRRSLFSDLSLGFSLLPLPAAVILSYFLTFQDVATELMRAVEHRINALALRENKKQSKKDFFFNNKATSVQVQEENGFVGFCFLIKGLMHHFGLEEKVS